MDSSCRSSTEQQSVINMVRILTRVIPFIFEDPDWENFFWSDPGPAPPLAHSLLLRLADLLFCPDFTVAGASRSRTRHIFLFSALHCTNSYGYIFSTNQIA